MAKMKVLVSGFVLFLIFGRLMCAELVRASFCPLKSVKDSILVSRDPMAMMCPLDGFETFNVAGVIEGDEVSLQRALNMVHRNTHDYVAVLFYASWCPFSGGFRPSFSILSSLYPSIPHFAVEESVVRPSILSKYGVHGFPTLFLLNSTMRVRYHGSRTLGSLVAFYSDVTDCLLDENPLYFKEKYSIVLSLHRRMEHRWTEYVSSRIMRNNNSEAESCPFSWARSPENLLQQETYLALATIFVLLRLLYLLSPVLRACTRFAWRRHMLHLRLKNLWGHPLAYLDRAIQLFSSLKEPCKRSNLQGGAKNAKAWASKSLASVSFGEASTSRVVPVS
ncbi:hypothetical protein RJ639_009481 [Escallonia herrerae]|uniref:Thioredoxin domain-containing protein n=1 Tax=Escallonia herrerae TaxID=1293975 RepID=A0AA88VYK2_9ASTE|nr:hypothetical protein RJ639_009481 [Escallonia herrerae]